MYKIRFPSVREYYADMDVRIEESWKKHLAPEFEKSYFKDLTNFVREEYKTKTVFPPPIYIFRAFDLAQFEKVKVVILGQDPYHGPKQANGLCFAVHEGVRTPPSLQNIFKELRSDLGRDIDTNPDLSRWAQQGVLLLNATLTVEARKAGSHQHKGWEEFTDAVIRALNDERERLVFILWGNYAKQKGAHIDRTKHCVLESAHPSPFSADRFFGTKPFSKTNDYLVQNHIKPVNW